MTFFHLSQEFFLFNFVYRKLKELRLYQKVIHTETFTETKVMM